VPTIPTPTTLAAVARTVIACERCPRLREYCERIARVRKRAFHDQEYWARPVPGFGDAQARLLVVGLAPAAHGGNRTGRVFTGDSSGSWLYEALHRYGFSNQPDSSGRRDGLRLTDVYVTAAARCAPPANRPTGKELDNCRPYLEAEIRLLRDVQITIALGHIAYQSWLRASGWSQRLAPGNRPRFGHGREARLPDGATLITAYHPSRQNTNTGRLTRPMWHAIFARARTLVDAL
jgi:uracil-DNA glycosylase family 4